MVQSDYCRLTSCCEAVTEAITKPFHVTWRAFADETVDVNWLRLLLEYVYLFNHLPAGCAVHLFPSYLPRELCVLGREQQEESWKPYLETWESYEKRKQIYQFLSYIFFSQLVKVWQSDGTQPSSAIQSTVSCVKVWRNYKEELASENAE